MFIQRLALILGTFNPHNWEKVVASRSCWVLPGVWLQTQIMTPQLGRHVWCVSGNTHRSSANWLGVTSPSLPSKVSPAGDSPRGMRSTRWTPGIHSPVQGNVFGMGQKRAKDPVNSAAGRAATARARERSEALPALLGWVRSPQRVTAWPQDLAGNLL